MMRTPAFTKLDNLFARGFAWRPQYRGNHDFVALAHYRQQCNPRTSTPNIY
jgi:hypothetical protein